MNLCINEYLNCTQDFSSVNRTFTLIFDSSAVLFIYNFLYVLHCVFFISKRSELPSGTHTTMSAFWNFKELFLCGFDIELRVKRKIKKNFTLSKKSFPTQKNTYARKSRFGTLNPLEIQI